MRVAVRKLPVEDVEKLQALVVESFDAIEPGLTVLDARLLLGHATIDVIGVDSVGALVLGNIGFTANEDMLLKAVEAYSWCLEYPDAIVRLYPSCQLSEDRPPRLLFVVERMPDAFHRKIKQLGFPEVDCVEFRLLDFDGVSAVYFESILRLRRTAATRSAPPLVATSAASDPAISPRAAERPAPPRNPVAVSRVSRPMAAPAPRVELPRPAEPEVLPEPEPMAAESDVESAAAPEIEPVATLPEIVTPPKPSVGPEPVVLPGPTELTLRPAAVEATPSLAPPHVRTAVQGRERVSFKDLADSLLGAMTATQEALAHTDAGTKPVTAEPLVLESAVEAPVASEPIVATLELELEKDTEPGARPQPVVTRAAIEEIVGLAAPTLEPTAAPALSSETVSVPPAPAAPERPIAEPAKSAAPAVPQGFEGLKFPNDSVLTRQWMEFLSQMSTSK
jgi:hypothetical protein